jgi:hypothetical protein
MSTTKKFKITYRTGATQTIEAWYHKADRERWIVFYDPAHGQVLRVPGDDIESIAAADVPDREPPPLASIA